MSDAQIKAVIESIIRDSSTEAEIHQRSERALGITGMAITTHLPTDETGFQTRAIVNALGGLIMKNGAMVMFMAHGRQGIIS